MAWDKIEWREDCSVRPVLGLDDHDDVNKNNDDNSSTVDSEW